MQISFLLRTGFDLNSRRPRGRSWRGGAMETGGQGSFQAVKLQRPARAAVCSHSTKDMAATRSIKSKLDPKPCSASVSIPLGTLLKWERKQASRPRAQFLCRGRPFKAATDPAGAVLTLLAAAAAHPHFQSRLPDD